MLQRFLQKKTHLYGRSMTAGKTGFLQQSMLHTGATTAIGSPLQ